MAHNPNFFLCDLFADAVVRWEPSWPAPWRCWKHGCSPLASPFDPSSRSIWAPWAAPGLSDRGLLHRGCYRSYGKMFVCVVVTVLHDALWAFPHANKGTTFPSSQLVHFAAYQDKHVGTGIIVSHWVLSSHSGILLSVTLRRLPCLGMSWGVDLKKLCLE